MTLTINSLTHGWNKKALLFFGAFSFSFGLIAKSKPLLMVAGASLFLLIHVVESEV